MKDLPTQKLPIYESSPARSDSDRTRRIAWTLPIYESSPARSDSDRTRRIAWTLPSEPRLNVTNAGGLHQDRTVARHLAAGTGAILLLIVCLNRFPAVAPAPHPAAVRSHVRPARAGALTSVAAPRPAVHPRDSDYPNSGYPLRALPVQPAAPGPAQAAGVFPGL